MAEGKPQFAAVPVWALSDDRLTDRDFRILAVVASHDRMSSVRGKGQGAWASHRTMAAQVGGGADYTRFSSSMTKLVELGYLRRERLEGDARKHTYRVLYTRPDSLPQRKPSDEQTVCSSANYLPPDSLPTGQETGEIVCRDPQLSDGDRNESAAQYISLSDANRGFSEAPYSAEADEIDSAEAAPLRFEHDLTDDANLARIERALKRGSPIRSAVTWYIFLIGLLDRKGQAQKVVARASRLAEDLTGLMSDAELDRVTELEQQDQRR